MRLAPGQGWFELGTRRLRRNWGPPFAAYACGVLAFIGFDPKGMLLETAVARIAPYLQAASWILIPVFAFLTISPLVGHAKRAYGGYKKAGILGAGAVLIAFASGLELIVWWQVSFALFALGLLLYAVGRW
ncbi:MAG TPA: hypothetical protein VMS79_04995 [Methanomassiliicoccales archaeon]|nr:hypothetical protein [Methanomassiliicoccales archaeon]